MHIKVKEKKGIQIVKIDGDINIETGRELRSTIMHLFNEKKYKFIIDLDRVNHLDSFVLGLFVSVFKVLRECGGDLVFINLTSKVRYTFEITQLTKVFDIFDNQKQAIAAFH